MKVDITNIPTGLVATRAILNKPLTIQNQGGRVTLSMEQQPVVK